MMLTLVEIRRIQAGTRASTVCKLDENNAASQRVRLSLERAESTSVSLIRVERFLVVLLKEGV